MDSGLETALVSASIAAVVSLSVAVFSPLFTHHLWKRQKRKEQQVAVAERYAAVVSQLITADRFKGHGMGVEHALRVESTDVEFRGMLFLIQTLFESGEVKDRARDIADEVDSSGRIRAELTAYLFAEALDPPFKKIPRLM